MNEEQIKNYIFFVCELIKQIIVIIIVLFYTCGYYYSNKVDKIYQINDNILSEINVKKNEVNGSDVKECNEEIDKHKNPYNFFEFIENIYSIRNQCTSKAYLADANKEEKMIINANIGFIQNYTNLFSDVNVIFGILMIIVYVLSQILIPENYSEHINNIFSDLLVKISTVIVFVPILLLYLYGTFYSLVFIFQYLIKNIEANNNIGKLMLSLFGLFMMYVMILLFIGILYLYKLSLKHIYGDVRRVNRNSLALGIDKAIDIFFNFDATLNKDKIYPIFNVVCMGVGFFASIGILFYSSSFKDKILRLQFCSPGRFPSYPQFFQVIKQFVCDEKSSLVIKNVTRILLSVFVVLMAFELLPISIAIFALVVVIYLIYKSFSYLMNIEC
jgi:hypothetical protein